MVKGIDDDEELVFDRGDSGEGERIGSQAGRSLAGKVTASFGKAFEDSLLTDKSIEDVFRSLASSIESALIQSIVQTTVKSLISSSGLAEMGTKLLSGFAFADGGVMTSAGPLPLNTYASGGVADSPQIALFGEGRTAEAYVPLPDGRSIPVTMQGGDSGQRSVSVVNNITVSATDAASFRRAEGQIGAEIAAKLQRSLRRYG